MMTTRNERRLAKKPQKEKLVTPEQALQLAIHHHQQQHLEDAEKIYRTLLKLQPENPDVLHYLGILLHQTGQSDLAISHIKQALALVPNYLDALNNLGNVLKETGDMQGAVDIYRQVLALSPNHISALNNLGLSLRQTEKLDESLLTLKKALELSPDNPDILQNLGNSYRDNENIKEAVDAYRKSLELKPTQKNLYYRLWRLLLTYGAEENSRKVLEQWIKFDPDNHVAQHHYLAHTGYMPEKASQTYIQETFDGFAGSFDAVLTRLDYRAPSLIGEALEKCLPAPQKQFRILDAGCGTGLSGIALKPYAQQLTGVDLSKGMLNKAKHRELYDQLIQADLVDYLSSATAAFDIIISADTLVYFGALNAFFQAASQALRAQGTLAFTLEKYQGDQDFYLNYHGRYAHSSRYVTHSLNNAGFNLHTMDTVILRKERGEPVVGLLVTAILK